MSTSTLIIGESGSGKSTSLRNLKAEDTLVLQAIRKPMPFKGAFKHFDKERAPNGNVFVTDNPPTIIQAMQKTPRPIIVIDDFQYILANEFMRRSGETGFGKFTDIGKNAWDIVNATIALADYKRVYILAHSEQTDAGRVKCKTIGKLLDEKITLEGMFSIVLRSVVRDGEHYFSTKNSGNDTVKSPIGLFETDPIPNDLAAVDAAICAYYEITPAIAA